MDGQRSRYVSILKNCGIKKKASAFIGFRITVVDTDPHNPTPCSSKGIMTRSYALDTSYHYPPTHPHQVIDPNWILYTIVHEPTQNISSHPLYPLLHHSSKPISPVSEEPRVHKVHSSHIPSQVGPGGLRAGTSSV